MSTAMLSAALLVVAIFIHFEALNGLLLIGWSTSFTFLAMRQY